MVHIYNLLSMFFFQILGPELSLAKRLNLIMSGNITDILKQPFPLEKSVPRIFFDSAVVGLFVALFLLYLRPFGIDEYVDEGKMWVLWGYGFVTFLAILFNMLVLPKLIPSIFNEEKWKVYSEIGFNLFHIIVIWLGNIVFSLSTYAGDQQIRLIHFFESLLTTISIGVFPITVSILIIQNHLIKKYQDTTDELNRKIHSGTDQESEDDNGPQVSFSSESAKETLNLNLQNLLLVKSIDNYVEIYTEDGEQVETRILRSSLKKIEDTVDNWPFIFRCHRTYLVNVRKISGVTGNSQGYKLSFDNINFRVPVSRNKTKSIRELLN